MNDPLKAAEESPTAADEVAKEAVEEVAEAVEVGEEVCETPESPDDEATESEVEGPGLLPEVDEILDVLPPAGQ